mgnify:FL=1
MFSDKENVAIDASESSMIGQNMRITGSVISDGAVICAGQLDGTVECKSLHILPGGKLNGDIKANHVIIDGLVIGNVKAERVQLAQHADFSGDLCCAGIAVDEGAKIQASFSRDQIQNG